MAWETAAIIGIPLLLEALSGILQIPKNKLQEYYDDSRAFRDYLTSLVDTLNQEVQNERMLATPSTMPRFDAAWVSEELKKKQDTLYNIKNQITAIQTETKRLENTNYRQAMNKFLGGPKIITDIISGGVPEAILKPEWNKFKKNKINEFNKQASQLTDKAHTIRNKPLKNNNPTYQSIQERKRNARVQTKTTN